MQHNLVRIEFYRILTPLIIMPTYYYFYWLTNYFAFIVKLKYLQKQLTLSLYVTAILNRYKHSMFKF